MTFFGIWLIGCIVYFIATRPIDLYGFFALTTLVWPLVPFMLLAGWIRGISWRRQMAKHTADPDKHYHPNYPPK